MVLEAVDSSVDRLRLAEDYYQAGAYREAEEIYRSLLSEDLSPWEETVVRYNLGTVLTVKGYDEQAINDLKNLSENPQSSPLLIYRAKRNVAAANRKLKSNDFKKNSP